MMAEFIQEIFDLESEIADELFRKLEILCESPLDETSEINIENSFNEAEEKFIKKYKFQANIECNDSVIDLTESDSDSDRTLCSSPDISGELSDVATPLVERGRGFMERSFSFQHPLGNSTQIRVLSKQISMQESVYHGDLDSPPPIISRSRSALLKVSKRDYSRKSVLFAFPQAEKQGNTKFFNTPPMSKKQRNEKFNWSESPAY
ncbi:uncharacterized protein LOC134831678 [Culicoides brevitarsis]|uniref:uncharacterized protein LOC134831678 n=1 Tax=Culicoides brevitarsis TaxID=469753 RepID=UPI00307C2327